MADAKSSGDRLGSAWARWRASRSRRWLAWSAVLLAALTLWSPAPAQDLVNQPLSLDLPEGLAAGPQQWASPEGLSSTLQVMLLLTVLSLAPAEIGRAHV